jgi:hypothetical protein
MMDTRGGFLGDTLDSIEELGEFLVDKSGKITTCTISISILIGEYHHPRSCWEVVRP